MWKQRTGEKNCRSGKWWLARRFDLGFSQNCNLHVSCNHFYVQKPVSFPAEAKLHFVYSSTGLLSILYQKWSKMRGRALLFHPPWQTDGFLGLWGCVWRAALVWAPLTQTDTWISELCEMLLSFWGKTCSILVLSLKCFVWTHHLTQLLGPDERMARPEPPFRVALGIHRSGAQHTGCVVTSEAFSLLFLSLQSP